MKNKLVSFTLCSLMGLGMALAAGSAQEQPNPQDQAAPQQHDTAKREHRQMDPNQQLQFLTKKLNLSADQQSQVLPILTDRQQQVQGILADNSLSQKDRHQKIRTVREDSRGKIEALLNPDQKRTFDEMKERQHQHRESHQNG